MQIGGPFSKFDVSIQVTGDDLVPDGITKAFGVQPSFACAKGGHRSSRTGRLIKQVTGVWEYRREIRGVEQEIGAAVESVLDIFPADPAKWQTATAPALITITIWFAEDNGSVLLPPGLLTRVGSLGANLLIDV